MDRPPRHLYDAVAVGRRWAGGSASADGRTTRDTRSSLTGLVGALVCAQPPRDTGAGGAGTLPLELKRRGRDQAVPVAGVRCVWVTPFFFLSLLHSSITLIQCWVVFFNSNVHPWRKTSIL